MVQSQFLIFAAKLTSTIDLYRIFDMDVKTQAQNYLDDLRSVSQLINLQEFQQITQVIMDAYIHEKTVYIVGNGGSASTASHMACDLGKGTLKNVYDPDEKRFRVVALGDNVATITAFSNDLSYDEMFAQQLHNLIRAGDIVIAISASGNSANILKALEYAKKQQAILIGFLGFFDGGKAKQLVDYDITIQSKDYGVIEDLHLTLTHLLTTCLSTLKAHHDNQNL
jgi:D-sedoheptulose 7-phosphate isomerase